MIVIFECITFSFLSRETEKNIFAYFLAHANIRPDLNAYRQNNENDNQVDLKELTKCCRRKVDYAEHFAVVRLYARDNCNG